MKFTRIVSASLVALALLAASRESLAQTWDGSSSASWNTAANWNTPASVPGVTAAIIFDGTGINLSTTTNAAFGSINSITFTAGQSSQVIINTTAGLSNMSTGTGLRFNPGTVFTVAAGDHRIVGTGTSMSGNDRDITFNGTAAADTYTFAVSSGASLDINARIGNGLGAGSASRNYVKTGGGTLILSGQNGGTGGWNFNNGGLFTVSEGVLRLSGQSSFGNSGNSYTISSDAAMEIAGGVVQFIGNGVVTLSGTGISSTGALRSTSGSNSINFGAGGGIVLAAASSIGVDAGSSLAIAPGISGALPLTKVGTGALTLTGANTYTGNTTVSAGTLLVNGSLGAASAVSVNNSSVLGGNGTIGGAVSINDTATLAPGTSPGTLTIGNNLSLASGAFLAFELDASDQTVGSGINDLVTGVVDLTLDGTLNVTSSALSAGTWRLMNYSGTLTNNTLAVGSISLAAGHSASINTAIGGQVNLVVVPEPGTLALLAGATVAGLLAARRGRRRD